MLEVRTALSELISTVRTSREDCRASKLNVDRINWRQHYYEVEPASEA